MRYRTPATCRRGAFTLVELLIALTIAVIMTGVAGSMLSSLVSMHQLTEEQSSAKRRAQDVFAALSPAMRNAGLGIPSEAFDHYFGDSSPGWDGSSLARWRSPIEAYESAATPITTPSDHGSVLRVMYSLPTGYVISAQDAIANYPLNAEVELITDKTKGLPDPFRDDALDPYRIKFDAENDPRSFVTFPGMDHHPLFVEADMSSGTKKKLQLAGIAPHVRSDDELTEVLPRGIIYPYSEVCVLRASVAFVDESTSTFCIIDVDGPDDPLDGGAIPADLGARPGFRIDGIKAVRFLPSYDMREMTVWVLVEGDIDDSTRVENSAANAAVRSRTTVRRSASGSYEDVALWHGVDLDDGRAYEDFFMTWRLRNIRSR